MATTLTKAQRVLLYDLARDGKEVRDTPAGGPPSIYAPTGEYVGTVRSRGTLRQLKLGGYLQVTRHRSVEVYRLSDAGLAYVTMAILAQATSTR